MIVNWNHFLTTINYHVMEIGFEMNDTAPVECITDFRGQLQPAKYEFQAIQSMHDFNYFQPLSASKRLYRQNHIEYAWVSFVGDKQ